MGRCVPGTLRNCALGRTTLIARRLTYAATAEQRQPGEQFRVEPAREDIVDVNLEATGKVGFNEDRVTPILAPFPGRVLEVLASVGDAVQSGQPLLVIESIPIQTSERRE